MRSLKVIRESGGKAGSSEDAKATKDAKEDDYKCTQRIERALNYKLHDDWEENTLAHYCSGVLDCGFVVWQQTKTHRGKLVLCNTLAARITTD